MKLVKNTLVVIAIGLSMATNAQDAEASRETELDKKSYYQNRALEDANYEQHFVGDTKAEEASFWKEQKEYEKNLKQKDKKAHRAYLRSKKRAYANHYNHCDSHCHHSDSYYQHASFYYYSHDRSHYDRSPNRRSTIKTDVRISTPSVRLGLF